MTLVRSIVRLSSANVCLLLAQVATILALGVVADPAALGLYFLCQTTAQFIAAFAALRLDSALPAARTRSELASLLVLALCAIALISLILLFLLVTLQQLAWFGFQLFSVWHIAGILLLTAMIAFEQIGRYWAIRDGHLAVIERATYARAAAILLLRGAVLGWALVTGLNGLDLGGLLLGCEILLFLPAVLTLFPNVHFTEMRAALHSRPLRATLRRNWAFPALEAPSTLIDSGTQNAPLYLVTQLYGLAATASFGLAYRVVAVPAGNLAIAITEVMQARHAHWMHEGQYARMLGLFYRSTASIAAVGTLASALAWLWLETIVVALLGEQLREFARIATMLTPWIACNVVINANSRLIPLLKRQDLKLIYDFTSAACLAGALLVQHRYGLALVDFVLALAVGQALAYLVYWWLIRHALRAAPRRSGVSAEVGSGGSGGQG